MIQPIKILMFGWEFPPHNSGGLGVACQGLVKSLVSQGAAIVFVLPKKLPLYSDNCRFVYADEETRLEKLTFTAVNSLLSPYLEPCSYEQTYHELEKRYKEKRIYAENLFEEVMHYAQKARHIALSHDFDIIHCHDWLSFPAAFEAKKVSHKPLVFHVHSTEFDRVGEHSLNKKILLIEKEAVRQADRIVTVSSYTKRIVMERYGAAEEKIKVVPNAVESSISQNVDEPIPLKKKGKKIVLFVGRLTYQKGPDYFLRAAKRVLEICPETKFIFAGSGDMERWLTEETAKMNISESVFFAGFQRGEDLARLYRSADLYVLSSVSEPFGLTCLEALSNGAPVLLSKQSGMSEFLSHCLKIDFWDIEEMSNKIIAVLKYPELQMELKNNGTNEVGKFDWRDSAQKCLDIYGQVLTA